MDVLNIPPAQITMVRLKEALKDFIANGPPESVLKSELEWALPATESTDAFVSNFLQGEGQNASIYRPYDFETNLRTASDLLDKCISQQAEIHSLEALSIASASELLLSTQTQDSRKKLAQLNVLAAAKQAGLQAEDYIDSVSSIFSADDSSRKIRLAAHNMKGSALNYGERIIFLREAYAENIFFMRERTSSARLGMRSAGLLERNHAPLPEWSSDQGDNLKQFVIYLSGLIKLLRENTAQQQKRIFILNIGGGLNPGGLGISAEKIANAFWKREQLDFAINGKGFNPFENTIENMRLSRVGIALIPKPTIEDFHKAASSDENSKANYTFYSAYRQRCMRNLTFSCQVLIPGGEADWESGPYLFDVPTVIDMGYRVGFSDGSLPSDFAFLDDSVVKNRPVSGDWAIKFTGDIIDSTGYTFIGSIDWVHYATDGGLGDLNDIRLYLEVIG